MQIYILLTVREYLCKSNILTFVNIIDQKIECDSSVNLHVFDSEWSWAYFDFYKTFEFFLLYLVFLCVFVCRYVHLYKIYLIGFIYMIYIL